MEHTETMIDQDLWIGAGSGGIEQDHGTIDKTPPISTDDAAYWERMRMIGVENMKIMQRFFDEGTGV